MTLYPPVELLDSALAAEQAGFDSIDASDHFHACTHSPGLWFDSHWEAR